MDSLHGIVLSSFLVALSGAAMPGPVLTVTIRESMKRGFIAGPLIILGHGILEAVLLMLIVLGFADMMKNPHVIGAVSLAGCAVLLWISVGMLRDIKSLELDLSPADKATGNPVMAGILTSIANPYWTVWWATIGLGYVALSMKFGITGVLFFFAGHIAADLGWYGMVSGLVSRGKKHIDNRVYRLVVGSCTLALVLFAVYFGFLGLRYLRS